MAMTTKAGSARISSVSRKGEAWDLMGMTDGNSFSHPRDLLIDDRLGDFPIGYGHEIQYSARPGLPFPKSGKASVL